MSQNNLIAQALTANRVVLSVIGPHAGEDMREIFSRKSADIRISGKTFWSYASGKANPSLTQEFFSEDSYVLFLEPATKNGARPTTITRQSSVFSTDKKQWKNLPNDLSPVTGRASYALILSDLTLCQQDTIIDLWNYSSKGLAIKFRLGASTVLAEKKDSSVDPSRMLSRFRQVAAIAKISEPYAVWIK